MPPAHDGARAVAYRGPLAPADLVQSQTTLGESPLLREVIEQRRPLIIDDMIAGDPLASRWRLHAGVLRTRLLGQSRAWMSSPLIAKGQPIGVLRFDHREPGFFTQAHADLAFTLANQTAVAFENARLYARAQSVAAIEERQRLARELHDTVAQTFHSISISVHAAAGRLSRDPEKARLNLDHVLELAGARSRTDARIDHSAAVR